MSKVNVSHEEIVVEILKGLRKASARIDGKLIKSDNQIPPVLLQEDHETYMLCRQRVYSRKWYRLKAANAKLKEQGLSGETKNDSHQPNSLKVKTYNKWSLQERHILEDYAKDYGFEIGCRKAADELNRTFASCRCKIQSLLKKHSDKMFLKKKFYAPTPLRVNQVSPKPAEVPVPVTHDIDNVNVDGYKIEITYKNGSSFIFNMETQKVNIKL